jgi:hypothetical protein
MVREKCAQFLHVHLGPREDVTAEAEIRPSVAERVQSVGEFVCHLLVESVLRFGCLEMGDTRPSVERLIP